MGKRRAEHPTPADREAKARQFAREVLRVFMETFEDVRAQYAARPTERAEVEGLLARKVLDAVGRPDTGRAEGTLPWVVTVTRGDSRPAVVARAATRRMAMAAAVGWAEAEGYVRTGGDEFTGWCSSWTRSELRKLLAADGGCNGCDGEGEFRIEVGKAG